MLKHPYIKIFIRGKNITRIFTQKQAVVKHVLHKWKSTIMSKPFSGFLGPRQNYLYHKEVMV